MSRFSLLILLLAVWLVACAPPVPQAPAVESEPLPGAIAAAATATPPVATAAAVNADAVLRPATTPAEAGEPRPNDNRKGAANPAVTVVEYGDFQCPACASVAGLFDALAEAYPDDVQIIYRHFPLTQNHAHAQKAAEAAEAAGAQGQFWPYHDMLFERQDQLLAMTVDEARDFFIALATELGLDRAQFTADLDGDIYADKVALHAQDADNLAFTGTPTVIVDGALIPAGNLPVDLAVWGGYISDQIKLKALEERQYAAAPALTIDVDKTYRATVTMENGAQFVMLLYPQSAPQTVNSFVFLAAAGWFDGVTFHRVVPGFVAQTGDPSATGRGGPGYMLPNEVDPALAHDRAGVVAMANSGPDTNGSQWYITLDAASFLDGGYTIFGEVIEGMDVVQAIAPRDPADPAAAPGDAIATIEIEVVD